VVVPLLGLKGVVPPGAAGKGGTGAGGGGAGGAGMGGCMGSFPLGGGGTLGADGGRLPVLGIEGVGACKVGAPIPLGFAPLPSLGPGADGTGSGGGGGGGGGGTGTTSSFTSGTFASGPGAVGVIGATSKLGVVAGTSFSFFLQAKFPPSSRLQSKKIPKRLLNIGQAPLRKVLAVIPSLAPVGGDRGS